MDIHVIDGATAFSDLRGNWDAIYEADPDAHFFLSWGWISDWLAVQRSVWFVLGAKRNPTDAEYVALLPMRMQTDFDTAHGFYNQIFFAGAGFSDYAGILTRPEDEAEAVPAFAEYLKRSLNWARFTMDNLMMSDRRRRLFLAPFDALRFSHTPIEYKDPDHDLNHSICPSVPLPPDWEEYIGNLSANNRQKIRRMLRKVEASDDYRISVSDGDTFDRDLKTLLEFWKIKWESKKGERTDEIVQRNYKMLYRCAQNGTLFLPVFWHGDRPVAALATLIDSCKRSLLFFITGRDETFEDLPAGFLLHAYSIRYAIAHGFTTYDFLRGNESYKYLFAPQERRLRAVTVATKTNRNLGGKMDPRSLPAMLKMTLAFEDKADAADAETGYRQILEMEPDHALALFRFGRFMAQRGVHAEAVKLLSRSVEVEPEGDNAWFWLARSLQSLGENDAALKACREVIRLQPTNEEAKALLLRLRLAAKPAKQPAILATWLAKTQDGAPTLGSPPAETAIDPDWILRQITVRSLRAPPVS